MKRFLRVGTTLAVATVALASSLQVQPVAAGVTASLPECQAEVDAVIAEHGGTQTAANEVSWEDGDVVMSLPCGGAAAAALIGAAGTTVNGCPSGWYCFYEHYHFNKYTAGRRLQFRDCSYNGTTQYFSNWGFENLTSSWVVNRNVWAIDVYDWTRGYLWTEERGSAAYVGDANNDRADYFVCYT